MAVRILRISQMAAKRSLAQRLKERGRDLGVAESEMSAGRKAPKVGGANRPQPKKSKKGK